MSSTGSALIAAALVLHAATLCYLFQNGMHAGSRGLSGSSAIEREVKEAIFENQVELTGKLETLVQRLHDAKKSEGDLERAMKRNEILEAEVKLLSNRLGTSHYEGFFSKVGFDGKNFREVSKSEVQEFWDRKPCNSGWQFNETDFGTKLAPCLCDVRLAAGNTSSASRSASIAWSITSQSSPSSTSGKGSASWRLVGVFAPPLSPSQRLERMSPSLTCLRNPWNSVSYGSRPMDSRVRFMSGMQSA